MTNPASSSIDAAATQLVAAASVPAQTQPTGPEIADRYARATWSHLAEPGDGIAGALVHALGPVDALAAVRSHAEPALLLKRAQTAVTDVELTVEQLTEGIARWTPRLSPETVAKALTTIVNLGGYLLTPADAAWPSGLADLGSNAPFALWVRGNLGALANLEHSVSVIGARAATSYGEHVTQEIVTGLTAQRVTIVSGASYGIDGAAHRAALASGGTTVAVLAAGVDRPYPIGHAELVDRIANTGAVVSEVPPHSAPTKWRFLARARILASISAATLVIEAGARSGSLTATTYADHLGRPVGAVPGPITSATAVGCHNLIRSCVASLVTSPAEVLDLIESDGGEDR